MLKDNIPILIEDLGLESRSNKDTVNARYGLYKCGYCGKEFKAQMTRIKSGNTKSCGCLKLTKFLKMASTHNMSKTKLYKKWSDIKARWYNPKNKDYAHYGGRGITMCDFWKEDYMNFYTWAMSSGYEESLSIDRVNVDLSYTPENCRWSTQYTQTQNTRDIKSSNTSGYRGVTYHKKNKKWVSCIVVSKVKVYLGSFNTTLEAAKAYEIYVRLNNLEHNFTPALTEDKIEEINKQKEGKC